MTADVPCDGHRGLESTDQQSAFYTHSNTHTVASNTHDTDLCRRGGHVERQEGSQRDETARQAEWLIVWSISIPLTCEWTHTRAAAPTSDRIRPHREMFLFVVFSGFGDSLFTCGEITVLSSEPARVGVGVILRMDAIVSGNIKQTDSDRGTKSGIGSKNRPSEILLYQSKSWMCWITWRHVSPPGAEVVTYLSSGSGFGLHHVIYVLSDYTHQYISPISVWLGVGSEL